ncbi:UDP-N-acetylglucosamine 2-epimerase [Thalassospira sp. NFXS8]|uniref:UDP-N-acetyl glucosamine 2-epimerase n=1 Tax=Thalassospira sp. NFXS8 TaxID=2819093 RepID=UPI0032DF45B6
MIVDLVYGTRPNIIKAAALYAKWQETRNEWPFELRLIDTGQHWDNTLSAAQSSILGLPAPAFNLHIGTLLANADHRSTIARPTRREATIIAARQAYDSLLMSAPPAATIAIGDVNGSVGVAQAAHQHNITLFHLEAGLRGGTDAKAEEANRHALDHLCDYLWAPDEIAAGNLTAEDIPQSRITVTGNIMIDALLRFAPHNEETDTKHHSRPEYLPQNVEIPTILVTIHRAENVDDRARFIRIVQSIHEISQTCKVIWPLHPRTKQMLDQANLTSPLEAIPPNHIQFLPSLPYPAFMTHLNAASAVITDSGGILEECAYLGKPAVIVRPQTERAHAMAHCGFHHCDPANIVTNLKQALSRTPALFRPKGWDGKAANRMLHDLSKRLQNLPV